MNGSCLIYKECTSYHHMVALERVKVSFFPKTYNYIFWWSFKVFRIYSLFTWPNLEGMYIISSYDNIFPPNGTSPEVQASLAHLSIPSLPSSWHVTSDTLLPTHHFVMPKSFAHPSLVVVASLLHLVPIATTCSMAHV
jgi:hypothetical protein